MSELVALTAYDVDTEERSLRVVLGKGRKGRSVPLTKAAAKAIDAYLAFGRVTLQGNKKATGTVPLRYRSQASWLDGECDAPALRRKSEARKTRHLSYAPSLRGDASSSRPGRHPPHPGSSRSSLAPDDRALHSGRDLGPSESGSPCAPSRPLRPLRPSFSGTLSSFSTSSACGTPRFPRRDILFVRSSGSSSTFTNGVSATFARFENKTSSRSPARSRKRRLLAKHLSPSRRKRSISNESGSSSTFSSVEGSSSTTPRPSSGFLTPRLFQGVC